MKSLCHDHVPTDSDCHLEVVMVAMLHIWDQAVFARFVRQQSRSGLSAALSLVIKLVPSASCTTEMLT